MELRKYSIGLLTKIHVITGWTLPTDTLLDILLEQFQKKLIESYPNTNVDEVEYAFRTGGTTVKDWGKSMNLSLIDEVMIPYLQSRSNVSRIEEQKKLPEPPKETLNDQTMNDWMEEICNRIKKGGYRVEFVPEALYDWLDKQGRFVIENKTKWDYVNQAKAYTRQQLAEDVQSNPSTDNKSKLAMHDVNPDMNRMKILAKKMIVFNYLKEK